MNAFPATANGAKSAVTTQTVMISSKFVEQLISLTLGNGARHEMSDD